MGPPYDNAETVVFIEVPSVTCSSLHLANFVSLSLSSLAFVRFCVIRNNRIHFLLIVVFCWYLNIHSSYVWCHWCKNSIAHFSVSNGSWGIWAPPWDLTHGRAPSCLLDKKSKELQPANAVVGLMDAWISGHSLWVSSDRCWVCLGKAISCI